MSRSGQFEGRSQLGQLLLPPDDGRRFQNREYREHTARRCGPERGRIGPFGDLDQHRVVSAFSRIVSVEALTNSAHLHADNRIGLGVERVRFSKNGRSKDVLLQFTAPS